MKGPVVTAVSKDGRLTYSEEQKGVIVSFLRGLEGKPVTVKFSRQTTTRSNRQNAYMWGVVYSMIAEHTGYETEQVHNFFREKMLPRTFVTIGGQEQEQRKSTADLTVGQMEEYLERVRAFCAQELAMHIPMPNEV